MSRRAWVSVGVYLMLCLAVGSYFNHKYPTDPDGNMPSPTVSCYEDEACWDCATMGNRICGQVK